MSEPAPPTDAETPDSGAATDTTDAASAAAFLGAHADQIVALLEAIHADRALLAELDADTRQRLLIAAGQISRPDKASRRKLDRAFRKKEKAARREEDRALLSKTQIRKLRENPIFQTPRRRALHGAAPAQLTDRAAEGAPGEATAGDEGPGLPPPVGELNEPRGCYTCQRPYREIHFFYDQLCPSCGDFNYLKRDPRGDLRGRTALVTGARVKIGYQAAILLLRAGCRVIALTRFPRDAARRYSGEDDFHEWGHRLQIHGIDLRHIPNVEALCDRLLQTEERLDFIINNACQTVRRPPGFYAHLMDGELGPAAALTDDARRTLGPEGMVPSSLPTAELPAAALSQVPLISGDDEGGEALFPAGALDADEQQVDLRETNSWRLKMAEVPTVELLEVHLVNAVAPFVLNARLKPLMLRVPTQDKHIVNVSAMEGQFYRTFKSERHPHTNMAKASLNMMTRTAALDYIQDGIHMNSVDTGWVTDEDPVALAEIKREQHNFHPPLDIVDGAARIVDPIFDGLATGEHVWGQFLKDYKPTDW